MNKQQYHQPPHFETIEAAACGDVCAMYDVLRHYNGYTSSLATRPLYDADGIVHMVIDPDMKDRMEAKLIARILKFRIT